MHGRRPFSGPTIFVVQVKAQVGATELVVGLGAHDQAREHPLALVREGMRRLPRKPPARGPRRTNHRPTVLHGARDDHGRGPAVYAQAMLPPRWNSTAHEWAVERGPGHVAFVLDGTVLLNASRRSHDRRTKRAPKFWDVPWYLILNTAIVGSAGHWPSPANASTAFPITHAVEYVRVARLAP